MKYSLATVKEGMYDVILLVETEDSFLCQDGDDIFYLYKYELENFR